MRTVAAAPAARASRLRRDLQDLLAEYGHSLRDIRRPRQLLRGLVYELQTRCGTASCHCASPQGPLHTATVLSWSERGRSRLRSLPAHDRVRVRRLAEQYRRFRRARAAMVKLHRRILLQIDRLEKA